MASSSAETLNIAAWLSRSKVNGPGERFVLWVQGCPLNCAECFNPEFIPFTAARQISVEEMAERILATEGIEGVTYSGGEPTIQSSALTTLSKKLKKEGLTIVSYSGYPLEELRSRDDVEINAFLDTLDILIDGPFIKSQAASLPWRGSRNQKVRFLTETYRHLKKDVNSEERQIELVAGDDRWVMSGTWEDEFRKKLEKRITGENERGDKEG